MTTLRFAHELTQDVERIAAQLRAHEVDHVEDRLSEIYNAFELLVRHPLIGRPSEGDKRELVIGQGARGYVARYAYDRIEDVVDVMALRAQRDAGFADR